MQFKIPLPRRYRQLIDITREKKPKHVVEIGTWSGGRATGFMAICDCYYTGFDLFEDSTTESDQREMNVKSHTELVPVGQFIEFVGFSKFQLIRGDTNKTLHEWKKEPFDFVFIDGGHSEATIKNDYEWARKNIDKGGTIILDDYYSPGTKGIGCNFLEAEGTVLPSTDTAGNPPFNVHFLRVDC